eukprot:1158438-Pelagomonas_calceolata.AAC.3
MITDHAHVWQTACALYPHSSHAASSRPGGIQAHLLRAQVALLEDFPIKGLDARCVSNLVWALVKLEVADSTAKDIVGAVCPLAVHFLAQSSSQGLANLLWSLDKMADPSHETMMAIIIRQVEREGR